MSLASHRPRAGYLADTGAFCLRHDPVGAPTGVGVVLVSPFGWEELASFRERMRWAESLAAAGHVALRFDLPNGGDSAGGPEAADPAADWAAALGAACDRLRADGCRRVVLLGFGFGGLIAARALGDGVGADELVTWSAPADGKSALRQLRALARLQDDADRAQVPDGWLEVGGTLLSPALQAAITALDPRGRSFPALRRALVLRERAGADSPLVEALTAAGVAVVQEIGPGYADMVDHPQFFALPEATMATVARWLVEPGVPGPGAATAGELPSTLEGPGWREEPRWLPGADVPVLGVVAQPQAGVSAGDLCVVLLNAGAVRRVGPNRLWTEAARRWAADGTRAVRLDLPGLGDSGGQDAAWHETSAFYRPEHVPTIIGLLDGLEAAGLGRRFVLAGLCSGAYYAYSVAIEDVRVVAAAMLNPQVLTWEVADDAVLRRERMRQRLSLSRARDLVLGRISRAAVRRAVREARRLVRTRVAGAVAALRVGRSRDGVPAAATAPDPRGGLQALSDRGVAVLLAFSGEEPLPPKLHASGLLPPDPAWRTVSVVDLPGRDHTLRSLSAQRAAHAALDEIVQAARTDVR